MLHLFIASNNNESNTVHLYRLSSSAHHITHHLAYYVLFEVVSKLSIFCDHATVKEVFIRLTGETHAMLIDPLHFRPVVARHTKALRT